MNLDETEPIARAKTVFCVDRNSERLTADVARGSYDIN